MQRIIIVILIMLDAFTIAANSESRKIKDAESTANILKDVVVKYRKHQVLHILAFVRNYSTLSTYEDTITLFREKWVDFMIPIKSYKRYEGWRLPRVLTAKSYYRFTNAYGLDSVSNECNQHFSWSDWVGVIDNIDIPDALQSRKTSQDTIYGKYGASEIWMRRDDDVRLNVDVMADSSALKWIPGLSHFFRGNTDFERFNIQYDFSNVNEKVNAIDLTSISCDIESRGRGRDMFMFNRRDEPFFVTTHATFYIVDKEFLTISEAKKWREKNVNDSYWPALPLNDIIPTLPNEASALIARVESINQDSVRLGWKPDPLAVPVRRPPVPLHKRYFKLIRSLIGL